MPGVAGATVRLTDLGGCAHESLASVPKVLDAERLHQQALLGRVQADGQRYIDAIKLLLAAGGHIDSAWH